MNIATNNYDQNQVPKYTLPELLTHSSGQPVTQATWADRRLEILKNFESDVYGQAPVTGWSLKARIDRVDTEAHGGLAIREEIVVTITAARGALDFRLLVHLPKERVDRGEKVPALIGVNFAGNHTTTPDPWVTVPMAWSPDRTAEDYSATNAEAGRGCLCRRWPYLRAIAAGAAVVTYFSGEIDEDRDDGFKAGIHALFEDPAHRNESSWGTISAWAWGLQRALDALIEVEPCIDPQRVGTVGHSRMGKTALWAAAQDERFAWAISNNSGCTGAALSRRRFGERLININTNFPHWFCKKYHTYNERESELPVDQHQLLALIAPRPLYVSSASKDTWADPVGEYTSAVAASETYKLLGHAGLDTDTDYPPLNTSIGDRVGYHVRPGSHDVTELDWMHFINFVKQV